MTVQTKGAAPLSAGPCAQTEKTLFLDFQYQGDEVRVASHEGDSGRPQTLRRYEDSRVSLTRVEKHSARIKELLGRANRRGKIGNDVLAGLEQAGQLLYEELFPVFAKQELGDTEVEFLVLGTDDRLVHIPWELAHDGEEFLCRRFSMGRVVSTRQEFSASPRQIGAPLSMLILADPQGNLPSAYQEGIQLRDLLDPSGDRAVVALKSSQIGKDYVKARLRDCDILHYAGHAEYRTEQPAESGFLLADGRLSARELLSMSGRRPFPALVFSNACDSGHTQEWQAADGYEHVYGLANAFLLAGVRHYLGTFWEVPDDPSLHFAQAFYTKLIRGAAVGAAVREARRAVAAKYGEGTIFWASYMLYGDPSVRYVGAGDPAPPRQAPAKSPEAIEVGPLRGSSRGSSAKTPGFGKTVAVTAGLGLATLLAVFAFRDPPPSPAPPVVVTAAGTATARAVERATALDGKIEELARRYRAGELRIAPARDEWVSVPLSLVFLGVGANGPSAFERDFLLSAWVEQLQTVQRITVVERGLLEDLLRELELGSSDLADPGAALKLGRILSANLIVTGSVSRDDDQWLVSLRVIETETTSVVATLSLLRRDSDLESVARAVGEELLAKLRQSYPLQARVVSVAADGVTVDIGSVLGTQPGLRLNLLTESGEPAGEIEVIDVETARARAAVLGETTPVAGQRVREILPPHAP